MDPQPNNQNQQSIEQTQPVINQGHDHGPRSGHELLSWVIVIAISVIGAYFLNGYVSKLSEKGIEPPPVVNQQEDETAGWQTYRNEEFGFEFRYPAGWETEIKSATEVFFVYYYFHDNERERTFVVSVRGDEPQPYIYTAPQQEKIEIQGKEFTAYIFPNGYECYDSNRPDKPADCSSFDIPIKYDNLWFSLSGLGNAKSIEGIYKQILSTFRFIETAAVENKFLEYENKSCSQNNECGGFPCVDGTCLVKKCESDNDCPNNLCGLNLTPVPGYCTSTDVE